MHTAFLSTTKVQLVPDPC